MLVGAGAYGRGGASDASRPGGLVIEGRRDSRRERARARGPKRGQSGGARRGPTRCGETQPSTMGVRGCSRGGRRGDRAEGSAGGGREGYIHTEARAGLERAAHAPPGPHRRGRRSRRRGVRGADIHQGRVFARARDQGGHRPGGAHPVPIRDTSRAR